MIILAISAHASLQQCNVLTLICSNNIPFVSISCSFENITFKKDDSILRFTVANATVSYALNGDKTESVLIFVKIESEVDQDEKCSTECECGMALRKVTNFKDDNYKKFRVENNFGNYFGTSRKDLFSKSIS